MLIKLHSSWGEVENNYTNSAIDSFSTIYCLWFPQTFASTEKREAILKQLTEENPDALWEILTRLLLEENMHLSPSRKPKYKSTYEDDKELLQSEVLKSNEIILDLLVSIINGNSERNKTLLDKAIRNEYSLDLCRELYSYMENLPELEEKENLNLWDYIREQIKFINNHPKPIRNEHKIKLEEIYIKIAPKDFIMAKGYYFYDTSHVLEYNGYGYYYNKEFIPFIEGKQEEILNDIFTKKNYTEMLFELMNFVSKRILDIGKKDACHHLDFAGQKIFKYIANLTTQNEYNNFLEKCIDSNINYNFIRGIIKEYIEIHSTTRLTDTFDYFHSFDKKIFEIYLEEIIILEEEISFIESKDCLVQRHFWEYSNIRIFKGYINQEYVINKLLEFEQGEKAFELITLFYENIESFELLLNVLEVYLSDEVSKSRLPSQTHLLQEFFNRLYKVPNKDLQILANLEFNFYHLLDDNKHIYLYKYIAENPKYFIELISYCYKSTNENEIDVIKDDNARNKASHTYRILSTTLNSFSGILDAFRTDKRLDDERLISWIKESLEEAEIQGYYDITLSIIGKHLAYSGTDKDGAWPEIPIREILAHDGMEKLREAYIFGYSNRFNTWWGSIISHYQGIIENVQSNIKNLAPSDNKLITLLESYTNDLQQRIKSERKSEKREDMERY